MKKKIYLIFLLSLISISIGIIMFKNFIVPPFTNHRAQFWIESLKLTQTRRLATGKGIKVALIDTGINPHPDLPNIKIEKPVNNIVRGEHGTKMAAIISAAPSSKQGVVGIAPECELISIPFTENEYTSNIDNLISAINIAILENVDIINLSIGTDIYSDDLHSIIKKACDNNIIVVSSSGNTGNEDILYPAKLNEVISVGSLDRTNQIAKFSCNSSDIDIFAPGVSIVTASSKNSGYESIYGTSASTAIVSGTIALIKEIKPEVTSDDILEYFKENNKLTDINDILNYFSKLK